MLEEGVASLISNHGYDVQFVLGMDILQFIRACELHNTIQKRKLVEHAKAVRVAFGADEKQWEKWCNDLLKTPESEQERIQEDTKRLAAFLGGK